MNQVTCMLTSGQERKEVIGTNRSQVQVMEADFEGGCGIADALG